MIFSLLSTFYSKADWIVNFFVTIVQSFRGSRFKVQGSKVQRFRGSGFKGSEVQGFLE
jgi:hypothetical protein